jgi:hypothetical protein
VVRKATGDDALRGDAGESLVEGETGSVATDSDLRAYVGIAPELFAANAGFGKFMTAFYKDQRFDGDAFLHQQNPFARRNVTAIVLEVPSELMGREKSTHGRRSPSLAMRRRYKFRVGACLWLRDTLPYELGTSAAFEVASFNGRALGDDALDVMLTLATNTPLVDGLAPDRVRIRKDFPYYGAPYTAEEQVGVMRMHHSKLQGLAHCFFLKDCCASPDQISFVLTFPWRRFVLAMRDRHRTYQNEIAIFVFGVNAKDFSHCVPLGLQTESTH